MSFIEIQSVIGNTLYVNIDKIVYVKLKTNPDANCYEIILANHSRICTYDDITVHLDFKISKGKSY